MKYNLLSSESYKLIPRLHLQLKVPIKKFSQWRQQHDWLRLKSYYYKDAQKSSFYLLSLQFFADSLIHSERIGMTHSLTNGALLKISQGELVTAPIFQILGHKPIERSGQVR